jgi:hypothetical protein
LGYKKLSEKGLEAISKPLFRWFAAVVPAERDDVAKSAKLVALNLENSGYRPQTVQDFALHFAKRFLTKGRKISSKAVLKWLLASTCFPIHEKPSQDPVYGTESRILSIWRDDFQ